jgi:aminoglycoside 3-N-acetyltransferase
MNSPLLPQSDSARRRKHSLFGTVKDNALLAGEVLFRQLYWRTPWLGKMLAKKRPASREPLQTARRGELRDYLREIGVTEGSLVMAHTGVTNLRLLEADGTAAAGGFLAAAKFLVDDLLEVLGPAGTLLMPTNLQYQADDLHLHPDARKGLILRYDPRRTPCAVGMANELFWRRKGTLRSLHPYNPLAARGPLAEELFCDNLNASEPLPHGIDSAYYRFCMKDGLALSVGAALWHSITIIHVPEEVRDASWPIPDFFERRRYTIVLDDREEIFTVRQRRPEFGVLSNCNRKVRRDLLREGILHEGKVGTAVVDWARAREVYDYFMQRNRKFPYPYYGARFAKWSIFCGGSIE